MTTGYDFFTDALLPALAQEGIRRKNHIISIAKLIVDKFSKLPAEYAVSHVQQESIPRVDRVFLMILSDFEWF